VYHPPVHTFSDDALVLDTLPFKESHRLVSLLTEGRGLIRGVLRGARGRRPTTAAAQMLSRVRVTGFQRPTAELATLSELEVERSSFELSRSVETAAAAAVVAELLLTFCPPHEPVPRHYRLGCSLAEALLAGHDPGTAVAYAQLWVMALGGVIPDLRSCSGCDSPLASGFAWTPHATHPTCAACAPQGAHRVSRHDLGFLQTCRTKPVAEVSGPAPKSVARWLDRLVRDEAHRPQRALDFLRGLAAT